MWATVFQILIWADQEIWLLVPPALFFEGFFLGDFYFLLNDWWFSLHSLCCLFCCVFVCIFFSLCVIVWIYVFFSVSLPDQCGRAFNLHPFPESLVSLILFNNAVCTGYSFIFPPQYNDVTTITFPSQGSTGQAFFLSWKIFILYFGSVVVRAVQIWPWPYSTQCLYPLWFSIESIHKKNKKKRVRGNRRRRRGRDPSSLHTPYYIFKFTTVFDSFKKNTN